MIYIEKTTSVLVLSDVHLGDKFCRRDDFSYFLSSILESRRRGNLPHLRALVILGDFFDLIWNTFENLCNNNEFVEIYEVLQGISDNGVEIVIALGNHEISTWGFYNYEFEDRKISFLNKLRISGLNFDFLNEFTVCQYVFIGQNSKDETVLSLFNSIYDVKFNEYGQILNDDSKREIILKHKELVNKYQYFMTHGYQFEGWFSHHIILAPFWKSFVEDDNERVLLNELWYELKQLNLLITNENIEHVASERNLDISDFSSRKIERDLLKINKRLNYNGRNLKNEVYIERIIQFLKNHLLQSVTYIIFGHSHEICMRIINNVVIMNAGCWVADKNPSYIEIYADGTSNIKEYL